MFDEWRSDRKEKEEQRQLFESLSIQLNQTKGILIQEEIILNRNKKILTALILAEPVGDSSILSFLEYASRDTYVNLQGLLGILNSLSIQGASVISKNTIISDRINKINSIAIDHEHLNNEMRNNSKTEIRSLIVKHNMYDDVFFLDWDDVDFSQAKYDELVNDPDFRIQQKIWYTKLEIHTLINQTLIPYIEEIDIELKSLLKTL